MNTFMPDSLLSMDGKQASGTWNIDSTRILLDFFPSQIPDLS